MSKYIARCIAAVFAIALAALPAMADAPARTAPVAAIGKNPAAKPGHVPPVPLLWKVSDEDNHLYLLGSFHLLKPEDYPLAPEVEAAFADAETLVFEIAPQEMASPALATKMLQAALRTGGTLNDDLPPKTQKKLQEWVDANQTQLMAMGMHSVILQRMEPWYVSLLVTIAGMHNYGLQAEHGLDAHFSQTALAANKPSTGLETGDQQIEFLDGMGVSAQAQLLDEALTQFNQNGKEVEKLHSAWRNGDVDTLWNEMALEMKRQYPELYARMNATRNDAWLPKLEQRLSAPGTDDTMVIVGALHLLGSDGLVEKLRAKGYRVERICSACKPAAAGKQAKPASKSAEH